MCEFSVSASLPSPLSGHMLKFSLLKNISSNPASSSSHLLKGLTFIATNIYLSLYFLERAVFLEIHWKEKSRNLPMITHSFYHLNAYFPLFAYMETFFFFEFQPPIVSFMQLDLSVLAAIIYLACA